MKSIINLEFLLGCCMISFMVGLAQADVGKQFPSGVYEWYLPLMVLVVVGSPFFLGIMAGRNSK